MADSKRVEFVRLIKEAPSKQVENVFIGLTYVLAILLLVFAIVPTINTIFQINREIQEKQTVYNALENKIIALSSLDEQYNENSEKFKDLTLLYPTSGNFSLFLSNIDAVVARNNFVLDAISFSEYDRDTFQINTSAIKPWSVRIAVSGKKVYLVTFLRELEAMPMFPVIESLAYGTDVDDEGNTKYSITLRIYHVENPKFYE
ncbi:hypothetical protein CVU76_00330 [Candidatus Dojkabacteria bacterium HGW-Dojkabacteria-1]|uniref:Uncharacterized protein n=1 Tax=Candidatus Dojkabacteria bacterium HGW-Dojkabacteria-1 TaxID=2013761 RepID=A0A2N2F2N3_9BACT|nr:MAG: hypothetical protein CVU76_00330 [Candidatus Dojkabacteria bacterium HGW-Dojkabacteria-1]